MGIIQPTKVVVTAFEETRVLLKGWAPVHDDLVQGVNYYPHYLCLSRAVENPRKFGIKT